MAERLEARGNPVVVTAPSQKLTARGPRIEYNLLAKSITLDGGQEVFLQQGRTKSTPAACTTSRRARAGWAWSRPRGRVGSAASPTIAPTSSWRPPGRTSCWSTLASNIRKSRLAAGRN